MVNTVYGKPIGGNWFKYKGKIYTTGTIVKFNKTWLTEHNYSLYSDVYESCWVHSPVVHYDECIYGKFSLGCPTASYYFLRANKTESYSKGEYRYMLYDSFAPETIEEAIEEIVEFENIENPKLSIRPQEVKKNPRKMWSQVPEAKFALIIYIILMGASLIFKEPWGAWIVLTIGFIILNNKMINDASGNGGPYWDD